MQIYAHRIKKGLIASWAGLGFYRGMHCYDFGHRHQGLNHPAPQGRPFMYEYSKALERGVFRLCCGFAGAIVYIHPFLLFLTVPKELYRLEVNVRGLEDEKKSDFYNRLLL